MLAIENPKNILFTFKDSLPIIKPINVPIPKRIPKVRAGKVKFIRDFPANKNRMTRAIPSGRMWKNKTVNIEKAKSLLPFIKFVPKDIPDGIL